MITYLEKPVRAVIYVVDKDVFLKVGLSEKTWTSVCGNEETWGKWFAFYYVAPIFFPNLRRKTSQRWKKKSLSNIKAAVSILSVCLFGCCVSRCCSVTQAEQRTAKTAAVRTSWGEALTLGRCCVRTLPISPFRRTPPSASYALSLLMGWGGGLKGRGLMPN